MKPQRPRNPRPRKLKLLVVCEGKSTEFTYLDGLCHEQGVQDRFAPQLRRGRGGDARVVVRSAINERDRQKHRDEAYEEVWCVLDVEGIEETARLNEAIALARREHMQLALSNPSFEVWLIAHSCLPLPTGAFARCLGPKNPRHSRNPVTTMRLTLGPLPTPQDMQRYSARLPVLTAVLVESVAIAIGHPTSFCILPYSLTILLSSMKTISFTFMM